MMMAKTYPQVLLCLLICSLAIINTESHAKENVTSDEAYYVSKTIVQNAVSKGAVCLDGSPPAYHLEPGFGEAAGNWIVQLSGGAWCTSVTDCLGRSKSDIGSSKYMGSWWFTGIFSKNQSSNSEFYNWNKVFVRYCDGGAFTGNAESVDPATNLHFRGARIFEAVLEDLLAKGLKNAKNALLSGSSAGAYPTMLYCDRFRQLLPNTPRVKCMADSGYFIRVKDPHHAKAFTDIYTSLVTLHGAAKTLPKSCTSKMSPELCLFPENIQQDIKTPLFIANSAYDKFQINTTIANHVNGCIESGNCTASENKTFREFRSEFLAALPKADNPKLKGVFIDSFNHHSQNQFWWSPANVTTINNLTLTKAFADWYYDRNYTYVIDEHDLPISALGTLKAKQSAMSKSSVKYNASISLTSNF
ncbi:pectin acetylesterase 8-like [Lycium barbarum]|uniref:pectin acetylesterase 8-like n=1 Tax=Lycium barbarum TaxID=112863 RepID=UPI00293E1BA3|nr:pectin acetylesterase 8-like [Lycium barbarum]